MTRGLSDLTHTEYDLLIVGGGINGASIANLAASAGAKVLLVEKNDWGSGTSSKSTKLLHGGLRYLENLEFDLVAESLKERYIQWKAAPHLVHPLRFIVPVYKNQGRPLWMIKLGVWLYDLLSGRYRLGPHAHLSPQDVLKIAPSIKKEELRGAVSYFDAQMDDSRLCLENVLTAVRQGAEVLNHVEAVEFLKENGRAVGARLCGSLSGQTVEVRARKIIVTAGPWADEVRAQEDPKSGLRLRPTKGVHLVCRGGFGPDAFLLQSKTDKRIFFIIPFKGSLLIGTTDTDYNGSTDDVKVGAQDIEYLLDQTRVYFPALNLGPQDIITTFAGLRPLVQEKGAPSKISRKHTVERSVSGIYYVMGGKYTTCRAIALDALTQALPQFASRLPDEKTYSLVGGGLGKIDINAEARWYGVDEKLVEYLISVYGSQFENVLAPALKDHSLKTPICTCSPAIRAQVVYSARREMAVTVDDVYERRLSLNYNYCPTRQCRQSIEQILQTL